MRVVWATLYAPHPTRGGGWSHSWELLAQVSRRHPVTLLCADLEPDLSRRELRSLGIQLREVSWRRNRPPGRWGLVYGALRGPGSEQFRAVMPGVQALAAALATEQQQAQYDL